LAEQADGVIVLVDNEISVQNLEKMSRGNGLEFSYRVEGPARYAVTIVGSIPADGNGSPADVKQITTAANGLVVMIGADHMGEGSEELGRMLIKSFIYSLTQLAAPPAAVIFLNGGARLTSEGSNAVPDLRTLLNKGVEILTCGACVNYYGLKENLAVGEITDMMTITSRAVSAGQLVVI
ncbi:MAG: sulfurtransferase-like selenium metabolism protein YedF, partial [Synergistaceae bacterium]|nr:sulfurtransferase-like selenium metabolism protein YedF [Synergistaceae bacterium]